MSTYKKLAKNYKSRMGINILPLKGKRPMIEWDRWQNTIQTEDDIEKMNWSGSTGLGGIQGINDWRCLDLDAVEDFEINELILQELGLPEKYCWVVQSGSGEGFHIYIRVKENAERLDKLGGDKAVYKFKLKKDSYCKHLELRWKDCQTALPPSMHESGGIYNFYFDNPEEPPSFVELDKVIECLEKFCVIEAQSAESKVKKTKDGRKAESVYYDKARLENALDYLSQNLPDGSYEEWYKIGFALVPLGAQGEKYFIEMSLKNPSYNDTELELKKKFESLVKDYDGRVTLGTIYHIAEIYGWKKPVIKFWVRENEKIKISRIRFKKFLESEGFCKYKIESNHLFVRVENNIVEEIDSIDVKEFVMNYLERMATEEFEGTSRNEIIDALIKSANQLFTQQFLEFLITKNIEFNKDTFDKGYFYFKNGFVEVSVSKIDFHSYKELNKHIWKKQIIDRNFVESSRRSVFEDFLFNVCRSEVKRYEALKSAIGYLLHTYKDPSITKSIVFIDEKLSNGAFGRSGKGLVIKSISKVRNVVVEDGRNFNPSKNFAFQRVKADTNIIGFEDIREKFPFERLFSIITDGITIERKNKDEIHIGYSESPKVVISTNFSISGVDDSTMDRQFIIEFSDYYNKTHRPVHDFGKPFFGSWTDDEWSDFDNFMIGCLQLYLKKGLVTYEFINLDKKKMIDETCQEFVEFAEEIIGIGKEYEKKELYESFKKEYEDFDKLTHSKFTRWLKVWGKVKNYEVQESKSGGKRNIRFYKKEEKEAA
ncbi:bifunctional DNA primase/polymerase [Melioribacter sp. OK-6-Me]|uniref:bifunctional DNA primase/polymerase n=1 Tax=unclassified Melioribacter TaxID=2627329 RepID=UPI003ED90574